MSDGVTRLLVTAPNQNPHADAMLMSVYVAVNWLEGRVSRNDPDRVTVIGTVFNENLDRVLELLRTWEGKLDYTVEEILSTPDSDAETYKLLMGEPGHGWGRDADSVR